MNFKYFQVISMLMILCGCSENRLERQVPSSLSSINQEKISSNVFPRQISAHGDSVCMLKDDQINCWGSMANFNSEIPLITNIKQISTSNKFACVLANDSVT